ncbi:MAG: MMPL family transporter [Actinomycetes bacterium]
MPSPLYRLGRVAALHPWRVVAAWLLAAGAVAGAAQVSGGVPTDDYTLPGTGTQRATELLEERFPEAAGADSRVVVHRDGGPLDQRALGEAKAELEDVQDVSAVAPPLVSRDGSTAVLTVQYDVPVTEFRGNEGVDELEPATAPLDERGYQVEYGGQVPENVQPPSGTAELVGIGAALVILLAAFGAVIAAGLPLAIAGVGLGIGTSGITLLAASADVSTVAPTLATMVGLGVGIDYALLVVTRHRDALAEGIPVADAVGRATATAGQSALWAGVTVLLALTGLLFCGIPNFATMGVATGIVVLVTMVAAVTLLPALLGLLGFRVYSRRDRRSGHLQASASHSRMAERFARVVGRRPLPWLLVTLVLLLALAAPALSLRIGEADAGSESEELTIRRAYDLVDAEFGPGANGPLAVAVDVPAAGGPEALPDLRQRLSGVEGVATVGPPTVSDDRTAALFTLTPTTGPQDTETEQLVERLRDGPLPPGSDVAGFTAAMIDLSDVLAENLWRVVASVIALSCLLLLLAFRSLVIPLKAAVVNLLSIGAALGVVAAVFQTEAGASLVGLDETVPVAAYVPVLMFAVLFGLSMDYEVFLLSRVREEWLATGQSRRAVVTGLASTARVISSAAAIMVAVFLGFAFDPTVVVKMMGVGMATAIAVDATLVRLLLVPAIMAVLGRHAWYLPRWLDRVLPRLEPASVGDAEDPAPAPADAGRSVPAGRR